MSAEVNYASWPLHTGTYIDVGDRKQLFLDDAFLVQRAEGVRYVMHQPVKHPENPLLVADKPWERQVQLYGSVLWDEEEKTHKMWYTNRGRKYGKDSAVQVGYAVSEDGTEWHKPELGLVENEGSAANNLVLDPGPGGSGGVCVLKTPWDADASRRYKMLYKTIEEGGGLKVAFSPDGIHWKPYGRTVLTGVFDTFNVVLWDDNEECYVAYVRINQRPRKRFRSLGRSASKDFINWSVPTIVLKPDGEDPEDADLYTSGAFRYGEAASAYFMMPSIFDWRRGQLWVQLATSRDNLNWRRAGERGSFIPLGAPGTYEANQIAVGAPPLVRGEQIYIYYHGTDQLHWSGMGRDIPTSSGIGVATLRLDGFISIAAGEHPAGGTVTTVPIRFRGEYLEINADASWGEVRVEVLDEGGEVIEGFGRSACVPVCGDAVRHRVKWEQEGLGRLAGTTVKLRFYISCAHLYAFQFRGGFSPP